MSINRDLTMVGTTWESRCVMRFPELRTKSGEEPSVSFLLGFFFPSDFSFPCDFCMMLLSKERRAR